MAATTYIFYATLLVCLSIIEAENKVTISTKNGQVKGTRKLILDKYVDVFYAIPFAKKPLGDLKFKKPQPTEPWGGVLDGTKKSYSCIQSPITGVWSNFSVPDEFVELMSPGSETNEDCLYVNVWTPSVRNPQLKLLNVLVWIHGGAYIMGSSLTELYDGSYLSAYKDFVFVSMNYRLGPAGFLYLGTEDAPGNVAFFDQALALDWVRENAKYFGGDPNSVTIIGESAGGGSVSAHVVSPFSRGKFNRAVIQSGTVNAPWSFIPPEKAYKYALDLAKAVGCEDEIDDKSKLATCFRQVPAEELDKKMYSIAPSVTDPVMPPTVDGEFFPKPPLELIMEGNFKKDGEVLIGTTTHEANFFLTFLYPDLFDMDGAKKPFTGSDVDEMFKKSFQTLPQLAQDLIRHTYTDPDNPEDTDAITENFANIMSDSIFVCPSNLYASVLASHGVEIYYFQYAHISNKRFFKEWIGAHHGEDIMYFFGIPFTKTVNYTAGERILSDRMMNYLVTFAKTGNPVVDNSWPLYSPKKARHQRLEVSGPKVEKGPRGRHCDFWNSVFPKVLQSASASPITKCDGTIDSESGVCHKN